MFKQHCQPQLAIFLYFSFFLFFLFYLPISSVYFPQILRPKAILILDLQTFFSANYKNIFNEFQNKEKRCRAETSGTWTVVWFCFFITYRCSKTTLLWRQFAYSYILRKREVNTIAMRVCYLFPKKRGGEKGETTSALGWKKGTWFCVCT